MSRRIAVIGFLLLIASGALAGAVDDIRAGNAAFAEGRHEEALQAFTRALASGELDPETLALAYNNRGVVYDHLGDYDRAILDYREALALIPGDPTALHNLRIAYMRRGVAAANFGDFERALEDLGRAIELKPSHHLAWLRRAEVRMAAGDLEGAARDLAEAETRRPQDAEVAAARERLRALVEAPNTAAASEATSPSATAGAGAEPGTAAGQAAAGREDQSGARGQEAEPAGGMALSAAAPTAVAERAPAANEGGTGAAAGDGKPWRTLAEVNVRAGPGNAHPVVRVARRGELLHVLGETRGWKEVRLADGTKGFVYGRWLEPVVSEGDSG